MQPEGWTEVPAAPTDLGRYAVWTGKEMVVLDQAHTYLYDPAADRWRAGAPPPFARERPAVVWTGRAMLVWGGADPAPAPPAFQATPIVHADGAAYDPATNQWRSIPDAPVPGRSDTTAVWTGRDMIIWGGGVKISSAEPGAPFPRDGAAYDPAKNSWRSLPAAPSGPLTTWTAVWTGDTVLFLGGSDTEREGVGPLGLAYSPGR